MAKANKAFILGAGLGTRLRPLTESLPKPLVPVANKPLITFAFDHLIEDLGTKRFMVNTHHCPDAYERHFADHSYPSPRGEASIEFRHEPVLLDTAGGIDNIRDWLPIDESFVVYNGDILTDLPLAEAWEHHLASDNLVTLVLRSEGDELRVGWDPDSGLIVDLRGVLQPGWPHRYQFTGIYFVAPAFLPYLKPGEIESVVLPLLEAIQAGERIGGFVCDGGVWSDLGERDSYLNAQALIGDGFRFPLSERISPEATIAESASIDSVSSIGAAAVIEDGARIVESAIWSGARVEANAVLRRVVVRGGEIASGYLEDIDL